MTDRAKITQADIKRLCNAAPDRVVEIRLPGGTVIRLEPGVEVKSVVEKREIKL